MIECLETRYGTMFVPDTDNGQYWWLKNIQASPEDQYIDMVCHILDDRPRGVAIDVGANFGCWTLPLARHASAVIAVEPQRCVFDLLCRTISANDLDDGTVRALYAAAGATVGTIRVPQIDVNKSSNFGGVSMGIPHSEHPLAPMKDVPLVVLDGLVDSVSFIKADVEGMEIDVLRGAQKIIARDRPVLFVEALHPRTDTNALGDFIQSLGYQVEAHLDNFLGMPL